MPYFIEFVDVEKSFGETKVLNGISFGVEEGETFAILGPSGVGKTVTLTLAVGLLKPDRGRIIVDGDDITEMNERELAHVRRKVQLVFQSGALFDSLTVRENISFPLDGQPGLTADDIDEYVAKIAHMLEVEHVLDKPPSELSTGMKRAVAIGRAFAQNPEAILYDEPTTMVDPLMAGHMGDLILRLKEAFHKTSIVVTHDTHLAKKLADTIVFLQEGRVTYFGPWGGFESSDDPFIVNFRKQDDLIPALDQTL